ncbi:MAG: DNA-processing protein DprA [Candidatus Peribacteria bacterium]|jgi:DNA processing protein|nr:DNA-processing protein DprA [Candidatus Peribacteria bacterium]
MNKDIHYKTLLYSLDEKLPLSQLKKETKSDPEKTPTPTAIAQLTERMENHHITGITAEMPNYPEKFSQTKSSPYLFYAMGNLSLLQRKILGIVGPREMSPYADQIMEAFFQQTKNADIVTVSGLANGVDHKCHQLSLQYQFPTIAILGGGLRHYLKSYKRNLIHSIVENGGLVISEFKLDFVPTTRSFPQRNRLIAGLSDLLFLPEAREGSGSLITADFALQMNKEIFVVPNQLFSPNGKGSNALLSTGKVKMLNNFDQILQHFKKKDGSSHNPQIAEERFIEKNLSPTEQQVLQRIKQFPNQELSLRSTKVRKEFGEILSQLTLLEMKGIIKQSSPGYYAIK